jgi:hypothetical protein
MVAFSPSEATMNFQLLCPLLVTTIVAVAGWFVAHRLGVVRERAAKRQDLRLQYILEAYRSLSIGLHWRTKDVSRSIAFDQALADIQLLGMPKQITLLHFFLDSIEKSNSGDLGPLLQELRVELRNLMNMEPETRSLRWYRTTL